MIFWAGGHGLEKRREVSHEGAAKHKVSLNKTHLLQVKLNTGVFNLCFLSVGSSRVEFWD